MGVGTANRRTTAMLMRLAGATALALVAGLPLSLPQRAEAAVVANDGQMLLEADTLVYNQDTDIVTAAGNVRIEYRGMRLVARKVAFNRKTARLIASGNVELVDRDGTRHFADEIDVTDDLAQGFANAVRTETTDRTYFAAESAERADGDVTTFNSGVYTACEPCEENPDKPPIWRIKATKIIWKGKEKTIRFVNPRLELFGLPIAWFPFLEVPDHTVKRKSGFLSPGFHFGNQVGFGVSVPYYWALSPTYDLTTTVTGFTQQGFLADAEWRQQFDNGSYSIRAAGIYQLNPGAFRRGTVDAANTWRGMIGTKGAFRINPRWTFGWDAMVQSDNNFAYTYRIPGFHTYNRRDEVYLTGLNDRNYFDLRASRFTFQEENPAAPVSAVQPLLAPGLDYRYTPGTPVAGGELTLSVNAQNLYRSTLSKSVIAPLPGQPKPNPDPNKTTEVNFPGVAGSTGRLTAEAEWRRSFIAPGGLMLSPMLALRGDAIYANLSAATTNDIAKTTIAGAPVPSDLRSAYWRYMATAGLEARWPILFSTANSSHVVEPVAQVFARPDAPYGATLGIPNEDAQSMVFDASTLFERDKFSGYDAIEGGVRANVGFRYSGSFANGWTTHAVLGQSYHIAGLNPFGAPDLVNAGAFSGLDTPASDYVGLVGVASPRGVSLSAGARLDEATLELRRLDVRAGAAVGPVSLSSSYSYIQKQPLYGFSADRHQVTVGATARVSENWRLFGSGTYDFAAGRLLQNAIGFAYDDECFSFTFTASQTRSVDAKGTTTTNNAFGFRLSLRTIGEFGETTSGLGF